MRLPLDVCMVFTANPEDYTARGKIITPLKDRIGSEIRTHYPATLEQGVAITQQEAWTERGARAARARASSARWRRAWPSPPAATRRSTSAAGSASACPSPPWRTRSPTRSGAPCCASEALVVPRISDIYAALPSLTGKFELEYEGELMGAENVARELIREAVGEAFSVYLGSADLRPVVAYFEAGGSLKLRDDASARGGGGPAAARCPGLLEPPAAPGRAARASPRPLLAAAARVRARGPVRAEEDRPQRRPRLRGPRAPRGDARSTWSGWSACAG